jgi:membrane associated rhomboid family serine protease
MLPLRDDNPTVLWPLITIVLILANTAAFFYELSLEPQALHALIYQMGMVPASLVHSSVPGTGGYETVFTSMFLHGNWPHLLGNMLYLWIFGNNVEDSMGHVRFTIFYLVAGLAAALAHIVVNPASMVPTIGASGAVSGVLGAYLFLFPRARIQTLLVLGFFLRMVYLPAWLLLAFLIILQVVSQTLEPIDPAAGGVAYAAHIGGFIAGLALIPFFRKYRRRARSYHY